MIFFPFYLERWTMACQGLTAQQEGLYLRLLLWMYANECALPADRSECVRIARLGQSAGDARKNAEKAAGENSEKEDDEASTGRADLKLVLKRFFVRTERGFEQKKAIAEIERFQTGEPTRMAKRDMETARKRQAREEQRRLYGMCRERGIETRPGMRLNTLREMLGLPIPTNNVVPLSRSMSQGVSQRDTRTSPQAVPGAVPQGVPEAVPRDVPPDAVLDVPGLHETTNHEPSVPYGTRCVSQGQGGTADPPRVAGEQGIEPVPEGPAVPPERVATAVNALRTGGLVGINAGHPMLLELLRAGVTDEALTWASAHAAAKGKPFAYAIAIAEGQMREAAASAAGGLAAPPENRSFVSDWAPGLEARRR